MMNASNCANTPTDGAAAHDRRQLSIVVIGSLNDVPIAPKRSARFVVRLGEVIVSRGHTLMTGCRGSLDLAIAQAAMTRLQASGDPRGRLVSFLPPPSPSRCMSLASSTART